MVIADSPEAEITPAQITEACKDKIIRPVNSYPMMLLKQPKITALKLS